MPIVDCHVHLYPPEVNGDPAGWAAVLKQHNIDANAAPEIQWNFEKFVIGRNGQVVARFQPRTAPDTAEVISLIERELGKE